MQNLVSCLERSLSLPQPRWTNQAKRVESIQNWTQVIPPALLSTVELGDTCYVMRELQPSEDKVQIIAPSVPPLTAEVFLLWRTRPERLDVDEPVGSHSSSDG